MERRKARARDACLVVALVVALVAFGVWRWSEDRAREESEREACEDIREVLGRSGDDC
jgi:hypothetical protein